LQNGNGISVSKYRYLPEISEYHPALVRTYHLRGLLPWQLW